MDPKVTLANLELMFHSIHSAPKTKDFKGTRGFSPFSQTETPHVGAEANF